MRDNLQRIILEILKEAGKIEREKLTPETIRRLKTQSDLKDRKVKPKYVINRTIKRLNDRGMVKIIITETKHTVKLTNDGREKLDKLRGFNHLVKTNAWDKRWRVVIMDIGESKRKERASLRNILKNLGFAMLRKSVWVYPYPCEKLINKLKQTLDLEDDIIYLIADRIDCEDNLKKYFFGN